MIKKVLDFIGYYFWVFFFILLFVIGVLVFGYIAGIVTGLPLAGFIVDKYLKRKKKLQYDKKLSQHKAKEFTEFHFIDENNKPVANLPVEILALNNLTQPVQVGSISTATDRAGKAFLSHQDATDIQLFIDGASNALNYPVSDKITVTIAAP